VHYVNCYVDHTHTTVMVAYSYRSIGCVLFCAVLCGTIVHSELHTHTNRPNSSLDWVLSHCAHFIVLRSFCVCIILCLTVLACMCTV